MSRSKVHLCQVHQADFSLCDIFLENPFLVLVHELGIYSFMFWKKLLESWKYVSPLFCFVLELCHNIIIENQNVMAIWQFCNLTGRNPIFLHGLFFRHHLYSKHNLVAAIRNLFQSIIAYHYQYPKYINFSGLMFQPNLKLKTQRQCLNIFLLHCQSLPITGIIIRQRTRYLNAQMDQKKLLVVVVPSSQENFWSTNRLFSYFFVHCFHFFFVF